MHFIMRFAETALTVKEFNHQLALVENMILGLLV